MIPVAILTLLLNRFSGDCACDLDGALRSPIVRFECDFRSLRLRFRDVGILRGPTWGLFFVLKFLRSRGISSTVSKVRSERKVLFEQKNGPVNSR